MLVYHKKKSMKSQNAEIMYYLLHSCVSFIECGYGNEICTKKCIKFYLSVSLTHTVLILVHVHMGQHLNVKQSETDKGQTTRKHKSEYKFNDVATPVHACISSPCMF